MNQKEFKPYIPASETGVAEFSLKAILLGSFFGILFGAVTVYLALRAGLTVSASIPIAVLAIAVFKRVGNSTILENNIVQTTGSAGESIPAGVVFPTPAFLFIASGGAQAYFNLMQIVTLAAVGGIIGVLLMVPDDLSAMTVIAASLSGVAAIAALNLHEDRTACAGFSGAMLVPTILYFGWRGDPFGWYGAASISTFLVLLLAAANRSERHMLPAASLQAAPPLGSNEPFEPSALVFKVRAVDASGKVSNGSAVLVAPGKLVTTCHVTRAAQSIRLDRGGETFSALTAFSDIRHDLCVLAAPGLTSAVPVVLGLPEELKVGDAVIAVGYRHGGKLAVTTGNVKALHPYDWAHVLQVSAPFDHGQSGGALFDERGRLIGITAFKAVAGGDFHFALPLQWLPQSALHDDRSGARGKDTRDIAFWEAPRDNEVMQEAQNGK